MAIAMSMKRFGAVGLAMLLAAATQFGVQVLRPAEFLELLRKAV